METWLCTFHTKSSLQFINVLHKVFVNKIFWTRKQAFFDIELLFSVLSQQSVKLSNEQRNVYRSVPSVYILVPCFQSPFVISLGSGTSWRTSPLCLRSRYHHPDHPDADGHPDVAPKKPHIKKPLNAFMLFMKEQRAKVAAECTLKESAAINQILGRRVSGTFAPQVLFSQGFDQPVLFFFNVAGPPVYFKCATEIGKMNSRQKRKSPTLRSP